MNGIKFVRRDGTPDRGTILAETEDDKGNVWVTILCENDDVQTVSQGRLVQSSATVTLADALRGSKLAAARIAKWPEWKKGYREATK